MITIKPISLIDALMYLQQTLILFCVGFLTISNIGGPLPLLDDNVEPLGATVHDFVIDPAGGITITRTATEYPLPITWTSQLVDSTNEKLLCTGAGVGTIEYLEDNTVGPLPMTIWYNATPNCDFYDRYVSAIIKVNWADHEGKPQTTKFRSNPTLMDAEFEDPKTDLSIPD